jgi:hypothetical protein
MGPEEINKLEKKYKEYLPMPTARQILKLIDYTRELEDKVKANAVLCPKRTPVLCDDDDD